MEYTSAAAWLQQHMPDSLAIHEQRPSSSANDDWKDTPTSAVPTSSAAHPSMDLSDYSLGDLPAPQPSTSSQQSAFYSFPQHSYFLGTPGPYNAVPYGNSQWPTSQSSHLPLSSYSSLNGATSSTSSNSQVSSQPSQSSMPMMIDPSLTTMSVHSSTPPSQYSTPSYLSSQHQPPQPQYSYQSQPPQHLSINPSFVHTTPSHFHQQQLARSAPQQPQHISTGTLSPYILNSPPNTNVLSPTSSVVSASSFYMQATPATHAVNSAPPPPTPEQRKEKLLAGLKPLLQPSSFTGAGAVQTLTNLLDNYGAQEIEPQIRLEVLTKIRDNAGNHYFRAWVENEVAMEITRDWLKMACTARGDTQSVETIMPLLHIIDRLPLSLETLIQTKLGRIIMRLTKEPPAPAIKDMASNLERKMRQILTAAKSTNANPETIEDKTKKRKAEPLPSKSAPPYKKSATLSSSSASGSSSSKTTTVKKEAKSSGMKDAKSDISFFSVPKPKPKLPAFKKVVPSSVKLEPDLNVAQPSSVNPFEEALRAMKTKKETTETPTPPPQSTASLPSVATSTGKRKKTVKWAPEGKLEMVKLIERAVYDDDTENGHTAHNIRDLERDEGAALHAHMFEEQVDWSEPVVIDMPTDLDISEKGKDSREKITQEAREQTALIAKYMTSAQIPDSPGEPAMQIPEDKVDEEVKLMITGTDVDSIFWSSGVPAAIEPQMATASVAELVGQLSAGAPEFANAQSQPFNFNAAALSSIAGLSNFGPDQLQQLVQQAQALQQANTYPAPSAGSAEQVWNGGYSDYDRGYRRCKYGDQCDFSHDQVPYQ
ncbi:hypothetical protein ABKN59_000054 [Abortiporus biennis]